jgi:hypothetical protein
MQARFHSAELVMHKGQTFELGDAARSVITGICGAVWLTRDGDPVDSVLQAGQSLTVGPDGRIWISAFDEARVRVEQRERKVRGVAERVQRFLRAAYLRFVRSGGRRRIAMHSCAALAR